MVEMDKWSKDHWGLLAYVETRCVDFKGKLERTHLRCNENKHPLQKGGINPPWQTDYSTRLKEGTIEGHDDWDCLEEMEDAGLIEIISMINGFVEITEKGIKVTHRIRKHKIKGGTFSTFIGKP